MNTTHHEQLYGVKDIDGWWEFTSDYINFDIIGERKLLVVSMMSDVQELVAMGRLDDARQMLNRAKWVVAMKL